jgi:hypothetical protein
VLHREHQLEEGVGANQSWGPLALGTHWRGEAMASALWTGSSAARGDSSNGGPVGSTPLASPSIGEPLAPEGKERMVRTCSESTQGATMAVRGGALLRSNKGGGGGGERGSRPRHERRRVA